MSDRLALDQIEVKKSIEINFFILQTLFFYLSVRKSGARLFKLVIIC